MATKTSISLDETLLERIDQAARELDLPRVRLLAHAAEEFLTGRENRKLLEQLVRAYSDSPSAEETELRRRHGNRYRRAAENSDDACFQTGP